MSMQVLSLLDQAIFAATLFLTTVIVGRAFSPEELGVYYLAFTVFMLLRGVQVELTSSPYTIYCQRRAGRELATYTGSTLISHLLVTVIGVVGLATADVIGQLAGASQFLPLGWSLAAALPFLLLREYIRRLAFARLQVLTAMLLDAGVACLQLGGLLLLAYTGKLSVAATYGMMGLASAIASGVWFACYRRMFVIERSTWLTDWAHNWRFARWAVSGFVVGIATPLLLPWMLAISHGKAATGMLAACQTLVGVSNMLVTGIGNVLTARAANAFVTGGVAALWRVMFRTAALYSMLLGGLCVVFFVAGDYLLEFIFHAQYASAGLHAGHHDGRGVGSAELVGRPGRGDRHFGWRRQRRRRSLADAVG
jgi:O-antigen/teichoic acid export membrane protein